MVRLVILLLTRRWGLILVAAGLVIGGLVWGLSSHQVNYISSDDHTTYRLASGEQSGNLYVHPDGSDNYYVAFASDFAVAKSDIDNSTSISFIARADTSSLDPALNAPDGTTINYAHKIEQLVFYNNSGSVINTYTTSEYKSSPNGFSINNWLYSVWLIIGGAVLLVVVLLYPRLSRRQPATASFNMGAGVPPQQPYTQPYQQPNAYVPPQQPYAQPQQPYAQPQPANPYGQGYQQGAEQYPQPAPYGQPPQPASYGQPPQYGQPSNPYQQPPQV